MVVTVRWGDYSREALHSCGRNGLAKQAGVLVFGFAAPDPANPAKVSIDPINSSGARTKGCSIEIPFEALGEVIAALNKVESELAGANVA